MWNKRAKDLFAAFTLGNGLLDLIAPEERAAMWEVGPEATRKAALWFTEHPTAMRLRGLARIGIGLWVALRQYDEIKHEPVVEPPLPWYRRLSRG